MCRATRSTSRRRSHSGARFTNARCSGGIAATVHSAAYSPARVVMIW
jgi:hypothetical protein